MYGLKGAGLDISKLKEALGDQYSELETYVSDLIGQRDAARNESINKRKSLKAEVDNLSAVQAKLFERLGIDSAEEIDTLPDAKGQAEAARQFEAKLKRAEKERDEAKANASKAGGDLQKLRTDIEIEKALGAQNWRNRETAATIIRAGLVQEEDGVFYRAGEKLIPIKDAIEVIAKEQPFLVNSTGARGSGYQGDGGAGGAGGGERLTRADFAALSPAEQMARVKSGAQITD